jgi:hypothetical protein
VAGVRRALIWVALLWASATAARADDTPGAVLELKFTPAPRAQIAIWLEDAQGAFVRTLELTEAVAFRGLGNRPGASEMNSGYRWPYGRREGVLPIWAARRAAAPTAKPWKRVIFQNRTYEGLASRTTSDQSPDNYYCLSFNKATTSRAALDAVSCASPFSSDKGRFITAVDVAANYHEPYEDLVKHLGVTAPLPLDSLYPPRMDVTRCSSGQSCLDHADVASFVSHAREVMPDIDAVTMATPPGNTEQSLLFSFPATWPRGKYLLWFEINIEGDYNKTYSAETLPTPTTPMNEWDSWAIGYGYPYRGQPSLAFKVPFELADVGETTASATEPMGRASWDVWGADFGSPQSVSDIADDPTGAPGSGADRLRRNAGGQRLTLHVRTLAALPEPDPNQPIAPNPVPSAPSNGNGPQASSGAAPPPASNGSPMMVPDPSTKTANGQAGSSPEMTGDAQGQAVILTADQPTSSPVGAIRKLHLGHDPNRLHSHEWVTIDFLAASSEQALHSYDVRVSTDPIVDEATFIQNGRPAKTASEDPEGAVSLMLPIHIAPGHKVSGEIGDLVAQKHYYVAVRATDVLARHGPISVAKITTDTRQFATVTPCFVATAAYGTPLATQVGALRRLRDRQLMNNALGRALVRGYYAHGQALARQLRLHEPLRRLARALLEPIVAVAQRLDSAP